MRVMMMQLALSEQGKLVGDKALLQASACYTMETTASEGSLVSLVSFACQ
jgi:hypothetical protein